MPVKGNGRIVFRAKDPDALNAWYREHLGVGAGCDSTGTGTIDEWRWTVEGGPLVFAPFQADTDYFAADKQFMLNFRVSDLDGLLEQLNAAGVEVITKAEWNDPSTGNLLASTTPKATRSSCGSRRSSNPSSRTWVPIKVLL